MWSTGMTGRYGVFIQCLDDSSVKSQIEDIKKAAITHSSG
tara:strand:+ start:59 stop:178 length:120 start_codon:yes stop_codon:yes gene_type:complete